MFFARRLYKSMKVIQFRHAQGETSSLAKPVAGQCKSSSSLGTKEDLKKERMLMVTVRNGLNSDIWGKKAYRNTFEGSWS